MSDDTDKLALEVRVEFLEQLLSVAKEENTKLKDEITRLRERTEWRPIETAPKDGTYIDIWGVSPGGRRFTDLRWADGGAAEFAWRNWRGGRELDNADAVPVFWMPRPFPPPPGDKT